MVINPIIYAEVSVRFERIEELEEALSPEMFIREELPRKAAFLAGKYYLAYKKRKGKKISPLPDFYIGAHAAVCGYTLLTKMPDVIGPIPQAQSCCSSRNFE